MEKSRDVPLAGEMVAPGVRMKRGAKAERSVPFWILKETWSLVTMGSPMMTLRCCVTQAVSTARMSHSALGASCLMQEARAAQTAARAIAWIGFIGCGVEDTSLKAMDTAGGAEMVGCKYTKNFL